MSHSGYTDPLNPALFAQFIKNSSFGLVEPHILQDEGHQLLSNTTQSNTTHTADCSSKALDTAPTPRIPSSSIHPRRLDGSWRRNPSLIHIGISIPRSRPEIDHKDSSLHPPCSTSFAIAFVHGVTVFDGWLPDKGLYPRVPICATGGAWAQSQKQRHTV